MKARKILLLFNMKSSKFKKKNIFLFLFFLNHFHMDTNWKKKEFESGNILI